MKTFDRIILSFIAVGIWTSVFMFNTHSKDAYALDVDARDIDGLKRYIGRVVENCTVSGKISVYDHEYGEITSARIRC